MRKALRYLRPYWLSVIAIVLFIFGQVQCELSLPDYMSNIVTYGIQYGGVTDSTPEVLSASTFQHMKLLLEPEQIQTIEDTYQPSDHFTLGGVQYDISNVYVNQQNQEVSQDISQAFLMTRMLDEFVQNNQTGSTSEEVWNMLAVSKEYKETLLTKMEEQLSAYTDDNRNALQMMLVKQEYQAIGLDTEAMQNNYMFHEGLIMLGIALLGSCFAMASAYLASRTATGASRDMRKDVFAKVESFSSEEFSKFSTASLITRTTNDIQQVQQVLTMLLRIVLFAPMMGLTSLFKVLRYPQLASVLGWIVVGMIGLMIVVFIFAMPKFRIAQKLVDRLNLVIREQLEGMLVIRAFNNEETEEVRFDQANTDITKLNIFLNRLMSIIQPIMTFMMSTVSILIIWIGANAINLGTMQIGDMMAFLQYAVHVLMSFMIVAGIFIMIPRSSVSAKRIFAVLETEPSIKDPQNPQHLPSGNQPVVFDHVNFRYPHAEQDVLQDINFTAYPNQTIAFIGSTGSGKSTLINLIPRFFDVTSGSIRIGDVDIRNLSTKELRDRIGYIPQKGILFSGTIDSNLHYADENASEESIQNALTVSQAKEFVEKMPEGLNEPISQGGTNVSGGQKQRLSIARALTKQADIYIFDDTFSALDYATDAKLREALGKMIEKTNSIVFIVAQRISTIMHADKIIVLDQGKVAGIGTHAELLKNCEVYQEIAHSQLSEEELAQ